VAQQQGPDDRTIGRFIDRLKESGETAFNKLSEQLLENPAFLAAFRRAAEAKGQVDKTVSGTMDFINLPSKNDVQRVMEELSSIGVQLARQQNALARIEQAVERVVADVKALGARPAPTPGAE
jgi:hypothetical protein